MKQSEIVQLNADELVERLEVESDALSQLKMSHAVSQLENPMQLRFKKKTIARLKSEIRKRELTA